MRKNDFVKDVKEIVNDYRNEAHCGDDGDTEVNHEIREDNLGKEFKDKDNDEIRKDDGTDFEDETDFDIVREEKSSEDDEAVEEGEVTNANED